MRKYKEKKVKTPWVNAKRCRRCDYISKCMIAAQLPEVCESCGEVSQHESIVARLHPRVEKLAWKDEGFFGVGYYYVEEFKEAFWEVKSPKQAKERLLIDVNCVYK